jgi:uncharacterized repeat protein (TIGR03847 family)
MASSVFDPPERFVAGTVGPPGGRTFFLQASGGGRLVSVSLEKVQVSVLADRVNDLLDAHAGVSAPEPPGGGDTDPLLTPIEDEFRVDTLALAWDSGRGVLVIECHDQDPEEADEEAVQTLRVVLSPEAARAFARRCGAVVSAGRPSCPFCGQPLDPTGHICPRANGYRR